MDNVSWKRIFFLYKLGSAIFSWYCRYIRNMAAGYEKVIQHELTSRKKMAPYQ